MPSAFEPTFPYTTRMRSDGHRLYRPAAHIEMITKKTITIIIGITVISMA